MTLELARPVAIALIRRDDEILVFDVPDNLKRVVGWRPPGGTIEFGERGHEQERFDCVEANGVRFTCNWKPIADFRAGDPLYPDGLLELIG